jgi:hypothetical protein
MRNNNSYQVWEIISKKAMKINQNSKKPSKIINQIIRNSKKSRISNKIRQQTIKIINRENRINNRKLSSKMMMMVLSRIHNTNLSLKIS